MKNTFSRTFLSLCRKKCIAAIALPEPTQIPQEGMVINMASWLIHLRIADELLKVLNISDEAKFVVGNIAPDCGVPLPEGNYNPPTKITHWGGENHKANIDYIGFYKDYVKYGSPEKRDFYLGYFTHLATDYFWSHKVVRPLKARLGIERLSDTPEITKKIKENWSELEERYLLSHGRPKSLDILKGTDKFPNVYFDFYGTDTIEEKAKFIASCYDKPYHITDDLSYMSEGELEEFIDFTVRKIREIIEEMKKC